MRGWLAGFGARLSFGSVKGAGACEGDLANKRETMPWRTDQKDAVAAVAAKRTTAAIDHARRVRRGFESTNALRWTGRGACGVSLSATELMRCKSAESPGAGARSASK